jgi:hypothetical protein
VLGYTLAEFKAYSRAVARRMKQQAHEGLVLARAAQADKDSFKKVEKALRDG